MKAKKSTLKKVVNQRVHVAPNQRRRNQTLRKLSKHKPKKTKNLKNKSRTCVKFLAYQQRLKVKKVHLKIQKSNLLIASMKLTKKTLFLKNKSKKCARCLAFQTSQKNLLKKAQELKVLEIKQVVLHKQFHNDLKMHPKKSKTNSRNSKKKTKK